MLRTKIYECLAISAATIVFVLTQQVFGLADDGIANKYFLEKQKFLLEIVHKLQEPLQNQEWIKIGRNLVTDRTAYLEFNMLMEKYLLKVHKNALLALNEPFILSDTSHLEELKGLYFLLYNAQDFETLKQNICWARTHVQAQMFIFALTQLFMKRDDLRDLKLPKIYEIWPHHFFADKYIRNLQHFNYVQWSRVDMYSHGEDVKDTNMICKSAQWWCQKNLHFKIYREKQSSILPKYGVYGDLRNSSKLLQALEDVDLFWLPVDFSRELAETKEFTSRSVTYLIEDKAWNAYWYYINMGLWLNERGQNDLYSKTLRDWWFWNLQQIVARYKMEEKSINFKTLDPLLLNFQGLKYKPIDATASRGGILSFINDLFAKTQNALTHRTHELQNKTILQLNNPEHFEYFLNENFAIEKVMNPFMSATNNGPTILSYFETMLRSKEFYLYAEIILNMYKSLKTNFESDRSQDLQSTAGITINEVHITELRTYFELADTDVTNLLRSSNAYFEGNLLWFKSLLARQLNLQHQPFKFSFNITSDKPQAVLVRTFLMRDCSASAEPFQLDTFVSNLAFGSNIIERDSKDFYGYMLPSLTYSELYHLNRLALDEKYQFPLNITLGNCGFPHNLKLPKGLKGEGLSAAFIFVITAYNYRLHKASNLDCDFSSGILAFDDFPPGFPFDREISQSEFMRDNVMIKKMRIYHDDDVQFIQNK